MMPQKLICITCGTQYPETFSIDGGCPICNDDRQYVPDEGQGWTELEKLQNKHSIIVKQLTAQLYELKITPSFAIGQRALLVVTPGGNILWDCIALINEPVVEFIKAKGGLKAIAFSHPHYYTVMNEWANTFGCPIYIHEKDAQWVFYKDRHVTFWDDIEKELWDGMKLINVGGHFPGSSILHLFKQKTILCGDTFYLSPSKKHLAVMYSYPNRIPLPLKEVQRIQTQMRSIAFDTLFGFYDYQNLIGNAKEVLEQSLKRYQ